MMFEKKLKTFDLDMIRTGDVLFRPYANESDQGHLAVATGGSDCPVLQAIDTHGVNTDFTAVQSHDGFYYNHLIRREDFWST